MDYQRTILAVDDEEKITAVIQSFLQSKGYRVRTAATGQQALAAFAQEPISLVLLDWMLPDMGGEQVCAQLRQRSGVPIIMLTAKTDEEHQLRGLGAGADDYITKPFSLKVLLARVQAVLRRAGEPEAGGGLEIDLERHTVKKGGEAVGLTPNEFKLLAGMSRYPAKVFTREELIDLVFGLDFTGYDRTIDSHIKNLRRKIECDPRQPVYIKTVHGVGYKFGGE